jgi:CheY-like chemotaxis protein
MKILVAEDNLFYRRMLETLLAGWDYEVVSAADGLTAWQVLQQPQAPRLAVINWMMPGMDGLELCRRLRALNKPEPTHVLLVTAKRDQADIAAALQSGADDYLAKPFAAEELRLRLEKAVRALEAPAAAAATPTELFGHIETLRGPGAADQPTHVMETAIPGYEILGELGRGGMGVVYKARHVTMNRLVALKVIHQDYLANPDAVRRFYQEIQATARLFHPNIVVAHDAGQVGHTHYLTMEYVDGVSLARLVKQSGPLPVAQACDFICQAALGLQHAHERGLVHRDINPANLMVTHGGMCADGQSGSSRHWPTAAETRVKILDMGLARLRQPEDASESPPELTREGRWMGTVDYIAPEQWMDARTVDIRADLYSLGCTFYYLLTGKVPFPDGNPFEKMMKHYAEEAVPIEGLRPDTAPRVVDIVRRLMAKKPDQRYQTPAELLAALQSLVWRLER